MKKLTNTIAVAALLALMQPQALYADDLNVVASIKPIHSLVAGVMGNEGNPRLMVKGASSPHSYQMRPSDAANLSNADLIVWVGEYLETFLERPIENLGEKAVVATLSEEREIPLLRYREGGIWEADHHADEHDGHEDHEDEHGHDNDHEDEHAHKDDHEDEHAHKDDHDQGHEEGHAHKDEHDHDDHGHDEHDHGEFDLHVWLDPNNASKIVDIVAKALTDIAPDRADVWQKNASAMKQRISDADSSLKQRLAPVQEHAFVVFHDAYQYFETAYGLNSKGAVTVDPTRKPSAKRLVELRSILAERNVRCVFSEPQFKPDIVNTIIEGTDVKTAELDPLGADVESGPDAWFQILGNLGDSFVNCLSG